ncbi:MAG: signal peptidase II [Anaerolineaceae bacterium]|nr:signal peptidase II [Anaerolineaceae bacterium]
MKRLIRDYLLLFSAAAAIIAMDQWTKYLVRATIPFGAIWSPWEWLTPFARIVHWNNTGAAFGMLQGYNPVFTILAVLVSLVIIYYFPRISPGDWPLRLALCLQLGGAIGNLVDRITVGQVTDFISVGTFPVFNIADSSISVGVVILLLGVLYKERQEKAAAVLKPVPEATDSENDINPEGHPHG